MWKAQPGSFIMQPNEREPLLGLPHNQYLAFLFLELYISVKKISNVTRIDLKQIKSGPFLSKGNLFRKTAYCIC